MRLGGTGGSFWAGGKIVFLGGGGAKAVTSLGLARAKAGGFHWAGPGRALYYWRARGRDRTRIRVDPFGGPGRGTFGGSLPRDMFGRRQGR